MKTQPIAVSAVATLRDWPSVPATPSSIAITVIVLLCGVCQSGNAVPIAYDGFAYATNQTVVGQGTDTGWTGSGQAYTMSQGTSLGAYSEVSDMTPYLNLRTSGNQLHLSGSTDPSGAVGVYRNLGTTYNTANNVYWFSVLLELDTTASNSYAGVSLFSDGIEKLFVGQTSRSSTWGVQSYSGGGVEHSGVSSLNSAVGFLVVELNGTTHTGNLYVNPTSLGSTAPTTPTATWAFGDFSFNRLRAQAGSENLDVDELRLGTSYADVTPVPEPLTMASAFLAITGLGMYLRKRSRVS